MKLLKRCSPTFTKWTQVGGKVGYATFHLQRQEAAATLGINEIRLGVQHGNKKSSLGAWTKEEDKKVEERVSCLGEAWTVIAKKLPGRSGAQVRERWIHQLDPVIKRQAWTREEDKVLIEAYATLGSRWSKISGLLPGRPANHIMNRWNSVNRAGGWALVHEKRKSWQTLELERRQVKLTQISHGRGNDTLKIRDISECCVQKVAFGPEYYDGRPQGSTGCI